jgi:hypothetical protein
MSDITSKFHTKFSTAPFKRMLQTEGSGTVHLHLIRVPACNDILLIANKTKTKIAWCFVFHRNRLMRVHCIWKVPGSNLSQETGYPEVLMVLLSPSRLILG